MNLVLCGRKSKNLKRSFRKISKNKRGILMTEQEVKRIEDQIKDLQSLVQKHYQDKDAIKIIQKEEGLIGKAFRKTGENGETTYFKPISLMHVDAPYVRFKLPINPSFDKRDRFRMARSLSTFDYVFDDDLLLYLDDEKIRVLEDRYEEITQDEFEMELSNLMFQVAEFSKKSITLKKIMGEEYEKKIQRILSEQNNENKEIPEEN